MHLFSVCLLAGKAFYGISGMIALELQYYV